MNPIDFLKILLDPQRLAVVGLVALEPNTVAELSARIGLRERDVLATLAPLADARIVVGEGGRYRLVPEALHELARNLPQPEPPAEAVFHGMTEDERQVLARFFQGRRLLEIPSQRWKRRVVLERIALDFEPGVRYPESEVNARLVRYHDDYAAVRRYLVDESFLDRAAGEYWRAGGRVEAGQDGG